MGKLQWPRNDVAMWCFLGSAYIESLGLGRDRPELETKLQHFERCVKYIKPPRACFLICRMGIK